MAVFEGFAIGPFAFFRSGGFLADDEVCSGGFFPPLTDSPIGDEYDNDGNYEVMGESREPANLCGEMLKVFLFFMIIALFLFF